MVSPASQLSVVIRLASFAAASMTAGVLDVLPQCLLLQHVKQGWLHSAVCRVSSSTS